MKHLVYKLVFVVEYCLLKMSERRKCSRRNICEKFIFFSFLILWLQNLAKTESKMQTKTMSEFSFHKYYCMEVITTILPNLEHFGDSKRYNSVSAIQHGYLKLDLTFHSYSLSERLYMFIAMLDLLLAIYLDRAGTLDITEKSDIHSWIANIKSFKCLHVYCVYS